MVRVVIATILGAVLLFAWGMAAWMFLPIHDGTIRPLRNDEAVTVLFTQLGLTTGAYVVPAPPPKEVAMKPDDKDNQAFMEKQRKGPIFAIFYTDHGVQPMGPETMGTGFGINLVSAFIAALILHLSRHSCPRWFQRLAVVMLLGVFATVYRDVALMNWMHFPKDWTIAMAVDVVVGWTIVGAVMAAIVKPVAPPAPATAPAKA